MWFTLNYDGKLPARGSAAEKEIIRKRLRPQLKELWTHEPLSLYPQYLTLADEHDISVLTPLGDHVYAPLICEPLHLLAELEITLLRPERPGRIVTSSADIDNQLKTLLDALAIPSQVDAIADTAMPSSVADPAFVLLGDDRLISRLSVDTDRLLGAQSPQDVRLTIKVTLRASSLIYGNQLLIA